MTQIDGPDPKYRHLTSSTGRVGHVTGLQADMLSLHYLGENKNEVIPVKWLRYWDKIVGRAAEWGKDPLLVFDPPPDSRNPVNPKLPNMHIITPERHAELLRKERYADSYAPEGWTDE